MQDKRQGMYEMKTNSDISIIIFFRADNYTVVIENFQHALTSMVYKHNYKSFAKSNSSCHLWHGSRGVFLKNRKISINYLFLRPYTHNLVKCRSCKLKLISIEKKLKYSTALHWACSVVLNFLDKMASSR